MFATHTSLYSMSAVSSPSSCTVLPSRPTSFQVPIAYRDYIQHTAEDPPEHILIITRAKLLSKNHRLQKDNLPGNSASRNKDSVNDGNHVLERESECPLQRTLQSKNETLYTTITPTTTITTTISPFQSPTPLLPIRPWPPQLLLSVLPPARGKTFNFAIIGVNRGTNFRVYLKHPLFVLNSQRETLGVECTQRSWKTVARANKTTNTRPRRRQGVGPVLALNYTNLLPPKPSAVNSVSLGLHEWGLGRGDGRREENDEGRRDGADVLFVFITTWRLGRSPGPSYELFGKHPPQFCSPTPIPETCEIRVIICIASSVDYRLSGHAWTTLNQLKATNERTIMPNQVKRKHEYFTFGTWVNLPLSARKILTAFSVSDACLLADYKVTYCYESPVGAPRAGEIRDRGIQFGIAAPNLSSTFEIQLHHLIVKWINEYVTLSEDCKASRSHARAMNAKSKYRDSIQLKRDTQKEPSDTHKTLYDRVKCCWERKINIKAPSASRRRIHAKQTAVSPTEQNPFFKIPFSRTLLTLAFRSISVECFEILASSLNVPRGVSNLREGHGQDYLSAALCSAAGATVAERVACSPQSPFGSLRIFACGKIVPDDAVGVGGFSRESRPQSPSSALKTSILAHSGHGALYACGSLALIAPVLLGLNCEPVISENAKLNFHSVKSASIIGVNITRGEKCPRNADHAISCLKNIRLCILTTVSSVYGMVRILPGRSVAAQPQTAHDFLDAHKTANGVDAKYRLFLSVTCRRMIKLGHIPFDGTAVDVTVKQANQISESRKQLKPGRATLLLSHRVQKYLRVSKQRNKEVRTLSAAARSGLFCTSESLEKASCGPLSRRSKPNNQFGTYSYRQLSATCSDAPWRGMYGPTNPDIKEKLRKFPTKPATPER
ncbi:hypothetical protein PR048_024596 [Dryococelus australis]|uniref:Uncharacterized protein n=1 Tax=Dryococelus australis TaxID=614101 RepID=A0ABQ9GP04_9NEOP|nr:hypothetical protein PR048_024596 [Dryococelus australis]